LPEPQAVSEAPFSAEDLVGVAINRGLFHLGLFYRDEEEKAQVFHLAMHWDVRCQQTEQPKNFFAWVRPAWSQTKREMVAMIAQLVKTRAEADGGLPYGFSNPEGALKPDGSIVDGVLGFTCASLVVSIFDRAGAPLLKTATWMPLLEDETWQRYEAIPMISCDDPEHAKALEKSLPQSRYRPTQVFAAACHDAPQITREECDELVPVVTYKLKKMMKTSHSSGNLVSQAPEGPGAEDDTNQQS